MILCGNCLLLEKTMALSFILNELANNCLHPAPEHLNSCENEPILISGKITWVKKQSLVRVNFMSRRVQAMSTVWRPCQKEYLF